MDGVSLVSLPENLAAFDAWIAVCLLLILFFSAFRAFLEALR